ncbi:MAG: HEAT repeat domain-containing protein, partial [Anaerolineaceae bacterium]|nr:HEAT repeat domain-containing protein [Anaerolineaceae bacterium]
MSNSSPLKIKPQPDPDFTLRALLAGLKDRNPAARQQAVNALARLGDARAIRPLIEMFNDPSDKVALTATSALSPELSEPALPI